MGERCRRSVSWTEGGMRAAEQQRTRALRRASRTWNLQCSCPDPVTLSLPVPESLGSLVLACLLARRQLAAAPLRLACSACSLLASLLASHRARCQGGSRAIKQFMIAARIIPDNDSPFTAAVKVQQGSSPPPLRSHSGALQSVRARRRARGWGMWGYHRTIERQSRPPSPRAPRAARGLAAVTFCGVKLGGATNVRRQTLDVS